jgi:TPR repeat protein
MANAAHDASGPASTEPAGIAVPQAGPPASSSKGKLRVFISYSRDDLDFADQLTAALDFSGFECFIDREGISGGEEWKRSLGSLISEADTIVFVLTPSSARSPICDWEVEEATRLNKRILPIIYRPLEGVSPPPRLRELNYIFFYKEPKVPGSGFGTGLAKLVTALNTDFDWLREHTRYLQRAIEWDTGGRPANRLLSGDDIAEAKAWVARRPKGAPEPTPLHLDFIRASEEEAEARLSDQRKQLEEVAAAQGARETALNQAEEALKQAADAQRRRARIRNIGLVVVGILTLVAGWLGLNAVYEANQAEEILVRALNVVVKVRDMDFETQHEAFALFQAGAEHGNATAMHNLGWYYARGLGVAQDYGKAREWYEKAAAEDLALAMFRLGGMYEYGLGVAKDYAKAREWLEKAAAKDNANAMGDLGLLYENGRGVAKDYAKAREWYEKAATKGFAYGMVYVGVLYENGRGVAQDYGKAREWYEKAAAAKDNVYALSYLGDLYENARGMPQHMPLDYAKAREWYEKAADQGYAFAKMALDRLPIREAFTAGRFAEALEQQEAWAAKREAEETKRDGKPGRHTAEGLTEVIWYALLAKEFTKALTVADRSHALFPNNVAIETNRAHALMLMGHDEEAKALYLAHKGEMYEWSGQSLEQAIADDFADFRKAGLTHPMMAEVETELGISR